ncbi:MAG: hypothetical protein MUO30_05430 [Anaerolineales bacterium]|nr:hypothetical protein [Anaerolineales bacterium]
MLAPVAHVLPLTTLRRERLLPIPGRVVVRLDQKVMPVDVIAEANFGQEHILLDVVAGLGVSEEIADTLVQVRTGDRVEEGQIVAARGGLFRKNVRSPRSGRVVAVGSGQILLEVGEGTYELRAGLPGVVTRLIPERGAEITMNGALIEGVWGNGRVDVGLMLPLLSSPGDPLTADRIDVSLRGSVLLCGTCSDAAALRAANELPVRGLILGSISSALLPLAMQISYPVVVLDGFDRRAMNAAAYRLLTTNSKREVTANGEPYNCYTGARPEIIIPLPVSEEAPQPRHVESFASGQQVRLVRAPDAGRVGTLVTLLPGLTAMPNGLRLPAGEVRLEGGEQITVPLANLEVLG